MNEADCHLMTVFLAALERESAEERAAYLDEACRNDSAIRARVDALLRAHEHAAGFLERPPSPDAGTKTEAPDVERPGEPAIAKAAWRGAAEPPGAVIGPYKLIEPIGEGGMGTVWMAQQTAPVKRLVAVKLIKAGMDSRQVIARFEAERQALALMDHPNIAKVLDAATTESGRPFFVMELVRGVPITRFCDEKRLTPRERLELFVPVCQAVQHAHQKGIIHRDLKPSNVLVGIYDGVPVPKVIDFGVAKATGQKLTEATLFTGFGVVLGTPEYMSPEQAQLDNLDIDTRSDIYSLGVLLYELLTGTTPLNRRRLKEAALLEVLRVIREVDPPRPSTRLGTTEELPSIAECRNVDPRKLTGLVRGELDWIVMKALEKDRSRRYETANGLAADLRRYLKDEPVQACPPSARYRLGKFVRRNKAALIAPGLILLATVVGVGMLAASNVLISRERDQKEAALRQARTSERQARASEKEANDQRRIAVFSEKTASKRAEDLAREDYINRVNRAYREILDDNAELAEDLLHGCDPERRGWEWHFVERLCNSERRVVDLGNAPVGSLAYSPDGTWVVSGSGGQNAVAQAGTSVHMWDVSTGQRRATLPGSEGNAWSVAVSSDGKHVAAGFESGLVKVWELATGQSSWTRTEPELTAMSVAFSPDGKSLAVGYGDYSWDQVGQVKVWDVASGKESKGFPGPRGGVNRVAFHPDGRRLAVAGSELVEVWDLETVRKLHELKGHEKWIYCLAYSPDRKWLATGGWDKTVKLRDAETGVEAMTIFAHEGFVLNLAFSPDGRNLATVSEDRSVRLWEVPSGRKVSTFHGHSFFVWGVAYRPDGREVATGSADGSIRFWDLQTSRPVVVEHAGPVARLAFRRDGLRVVSEPYYRTGSTDTKGWNPLTGQLDPALTGTAFGDRPAGFVPGSDHLQTTATSFDGKLIAQVTIADAGFDLWGRMHALNTVVIREVTSGRIVHTLTGHSANVVSIAFSPEGRRLATASYDRTMKLWDVETGHNVFTLLGHTAGLVCLAFSPDGNQIVTGSFDATARVWNGAPIASSVTAAHDARYRKKVETLAKLKATTDDALRADASHRKAIELDPDGALAFKGLADIHGRKGQWKEAYASLARAIELDPNDHLSAFLLGPLVAERGDLPAYQDYCKTMLSRWRGVADPAEAERTITACLLLPGGVHDPEQLAPLMKRAMSAREMHDDYSWIRFAEGLYHYRCGRFEEALRACGKSLERSAPDPPLLVMNHYVEAMSLHYLGKAEEARQAMAKASRLLDRKSPRLDSIDGPWNAWLCCRILRREAEARIEPTKEPGP
jgi:WD40 repeat protein/serine/threonine protein kinase